MTSKMPNRGLVSLSVGVHWSLWGRCREGAGVGVAGHMYQQPKPGVVMSETLLSLEKAPMISPCRTVNNAGKEMFTRLFQIFNGEELILSSYAHCSVWK